MSLRAPALLLKTGNSSNNNKSATLKSNCTLDDYDTPPESPGIQDSMENISETQLACTSPSPPVPPPRPKRDKKAANLKSLNISPEPSQVRCRNGFNDETNISLNVPHFIATCFDGQNKLEWFKLQKLFKFRNGPPQWSQSKLFFCCKMFSEACTNFSTCQIMSKMDLLQHNTFIIKLNSSFYVNFSWRLSCLAHRSCVRGWLSTFISFYLTANKFITMGQWLWFSW